MIPVFEPDLGEEEIQAVVAALRAGEISGSFSPTIEKFEEEFANYSDCKYGVAVTSGSTALHLAMSALEIKAGDEVLVSASTNIASALCVYHHGALTIPIDSHPETWNLDTDLIEGLITPRTKAIIPVHLYGLPVEMNPILKLAEKYNLSVIEDAAEAHGATYHGKKVGSFGKMACFSFYFNKVITTGEGGMIVTNDAEIAARLRLLRNLAFQQPRFFHEHAGYNFRMTGYQAAMGRAQFQKIEKIIQDKIRVANTYSDHLKDCLEIQTPINHSYTRNVYWMYGIILKNRDISTRNKLMADLKSKGIETRTFFCPLNLQPFLIKQMAGRMPPCPTAEKLWNLGLYLPSSPKLSKETIQTISETLITLLESY